MAISKKPLKKEWNVDAMNKTINTLTSSTLFALPKCLSCKHLLADQGESLVCKAFPDGIPDTALWEPKEITCSNSIYFEEE